MGLLTVLKKLKQKEKTLRLLMLYAFQIAFHDAKDYNPAEMALDGCFQDYSKTTIVKRFNGEDVSTISPTLGFNIFTLDYGEKKLNLWDIGGQKSLRFYWRNYFEQTDGIIWVIDSADRRRLQDCKEEFDKLLEEEKLAGATLLVFANKQDLPGSLTKEEIAEMLELEKIVNRHWMIVSCSAVTGDGLSDGVSWIVNDISSRIFMLD